MAVLVDLTDEEAQFITDLLDWWNEGLKDAENMTIEDQNLNLEELLIAAGGLKDTEQMCASIKSKFSNGA